MDETVDVFLWPEKPVGRLWFRSSNGRESASFQYDPAWLTGEGGQNANFALEPALNFSAETFHTRNMSLFGAFGDSTPDRWGRNLMRRREERQARIAGKTPRSLSEIDFLLEVNDEARPGALRFKKPESGEFLSVSEKNAIPTLAVLPALLSASERFLESNESDEDLKLLLAPGSSLGGARPKASFYDSGDLSVAKFPRKDDDFSSTLREALALSLAQKAGIQVPSWRIETALKKPVLILKRFDRQGQKRIPFLSAMSMLGARDNEEHSYLEIACALIQYGAQPIDDLEELWRRLVFNICISNTDDHLRNHGFLFLSQEDGALSSGWRLSPAYDMNPVPHQAGPPLLSLSVDMVNRQASLDTALSVIGEFKLEREKALLVLDEVYRAVKDWQNTARSLGIHRAETERMAGAFEAIN